MSDDLHTQDILNVAIPDTLKLMNESIKALTKEKQQLRKQSLFHTLVALETVAKEVLSTLGLLSSSTSSEVMQQLKDKAFGRAGFTEEKFATLVEERSQARQNQDYAKSDQIRQELSTKGIALMDVGKKTTWAPCVPTSTKQEQPVAAPCVPTSTKKEQPCMQLLLTESGLNKTVSLE